LLEGYSMFDLMKQAIEVLKHKIALNLDEVKQNEIRFRSLLSKSNGKSATDEMNKLLEANKNLLSENFDFLNLQISLIKFMEKHQKQQVYSISENNEFDIENQIEPQDIFELTLSGDIEYNNVHPLFYDEEFFGRIMCYYEDNNQMEKSLVFIQAKACGNCN
jgi:hypothetical protein